MSDLNGTMLDTDDDLFDFDDEEEIDIDTPGEDEEEEELELPLDEGEVEIDLDEETDREEIGEEIDLDDESGIVSNDIEEETISEDIETANEMAESEDETGVESNNTSNDDLLGGIDLDSILDSIENEIDSLEESSANDIEEPNNEDEANTNDEETDSSEEGTYNDEEDNNEELETSNELPSNIVPDSEAENVYEDENGNMFTRNDNRPIGYDADYNLVYLDVDTSNENQGGSSEEPDIENDGDDVLANISNDSFSDSLEEDPLDDTDNPDEEDELDDSIIEPEAHDFIDENGNLVVMNGGDVGDTFEIKVISYKNIAIAKRIRSGKSVEDLVQSVKSTGLLNPIMVAPLATKDMYVLIDGYRRILACARAGITDIPAIVNNKIRTTEIPIVEAMYNHKKAYTMQDTIDYIEYLEKEKGLTNPSLIEFLMDFDNGDYSKLKDILADDDEDIVTKLVAGQMTIAQAFKALEKRRSKESKEEKDIKKAAKVYGDDEESGANEIANMGETGDEGSALTDEQLEELAINPTELDEGLDDQSLSDMIQESDETPGFEAHQQKVGEREYVDPVIKKTVLARDNFTCKCCKRGGESYVDSLDYHHLTPVFLGGKDTPENGATLCVLCHRLVHLFSTGDLHIPKEKTEEEVGQMTDEERIIYEDEQRKFKRVVKLGDVIRKGMAQRGINREQYKKEHPNNQIGRRKPGKNANQEEA